MNQLFQQIERQMERLQAHLGAQPELREAFDLHVDTSWIYHDHALEGVVLSHHELNSALDDAIISDSTLIPHYDELRNHKIAIERIRQQATRRKAAIGLEFTKELHEILSDEVLPRAASKGAAKVVGQYRKDNPLHRLYFHEIVPPEKISYHMRKLVQWFGSEEAKRTHPVQRAALAHYKLITIYPWPHHSGKVSRLLMNTFLLRDGFLPAVIHAVERQRYYEALRQPPAVLTQLVAESLRRTLESSLKLFEQKAVREAS